MIQPVKFEMDLRDSVWESINTIVECSVWYFHQGSNNAIVHTVHTLPGMKRILIKMLAFEPSEGENNTIVLINSPRNEEDFN